MTCAVRHLPTHVAAAALTTVGLACAALLLGGCSGGRVVDASLSAVAQPSGFLEASYPADGVKLSVPRNWTATAEAAPMIAVFSSGPAIMSLWRYPTRQAAVTSAGELMARLQTLLAAVKSKDPSFRLQASGLSSVAGNGAVIIDGIEQVNGRARRVRTEHVYLDDAELVLDAYAPVAEFPSVDHAVFSPVRKSLTLIDGGATKAGAAASTSTTAAGATPTATTGTATTGTATTGTATTGGGA